MTDGIRKTLAYGTVTAFLAAICLPLLAMPSGLRRAPAASSNEQRALNPLPSFPAKAQDLPAFFRGLDLWFGDHFGFRDRLVRWHSWLSYHTLHTSPSPRVILGRAGWLFYTGDGMNTDGDPINDYEGAKPLTEAQLIWIRRMVEDEYLWLKAQGIRYLYVLIPSKEELYSEYLPTYIKRVGPKTPREQVLDDLRRQTDVPVLDLTPALAQAKERGRLFCKTDSHWSFLGAYVGYCEIVKTISPWFPPMAPWDDADLQWSAESFKRGDLARLIGLGGALGEELVNATPRRHRAAGLSRLGTDTYAPFEADTGNAALPSVLVYHDSFSYLLVPFLAEHFERARFEWGQTGTKMSEVEGFRPNLVLQIMTDRFLRLDLKYRPAIQAYGDRKRFEISTNVVGRYESATRFEGLRMLDGMGLGGGDGSSVLRTRHSPARVGIPAVPRTSDVLPIIRIDATAAQEGRVLLSWDGMTHGPLSASLRTGSNDVCFFVAEPGVKGPFQVQFESGEQPLSLRSVEVRGWPSGFLRDKR